jgi:hypothetical protein
MNPHFTIDLWTVVSVLAAAAGTLWGGNRLYKTFGADTKNAIGSAIRRRSGFNQAATDSENLILASAQRADTNNVLMLEKLEKMYTNYAALAHKAGKAEGKAEMLEKQMFPNSAFVEVRQDKERDVFGEPFERSSNRDSERSEQNDGLELQDKSQRRQHLLREHQNEDEYDFRLRRTDSASEQRRTRRRSRDDSSDD